MSLSSSSSRMLGRRPLQGPSEGPPALCPATWPAGPPAPAQQHDGPQRAWYQVQQCWLALHMSQQHASVSGNASITRPERLVISSLCMCAGQACSRQEDNTSRVSPHVHE